MILPRGVWPLLLVCGAVAGTVARADQAILGRKFVVADPVPADPTMRTLKAVAREGKSAATLTGDPTLATGFGGATLEVTANGSSPSWQVFGLAPGTSAKGRPFWRAIGTKGYRYRDAAGEQGPVRAVVVKRTPGGSFRMKAVVEGSDVVPPNAGTDAAVALTLSQGERLCAKYGPESTIRNDGASSFSAARPSDVGCGAPPETSGDFLLLNYNVAGLPEGISGSHPATNTQIISPLLNAYDVVLVQESWQTPDPNPLAPLRVYHEILSADANHPYKTVSAPLPIGTDPRRPSALVSDGLNAFSQFPFTHLDRQMWNDCYASSADCLSQKGFMVIRMTVAPGVTIDVYDLHMEAGGDPEDDALRDAAVTQLGTYLNAFSAGRPVIVAGDFNLHTNGEPDGSQYQRLQDDTGLVDVCEALACGETGHIEKVLFRSTPALTISPLTWQFETGVFVDGMGEQLSDHEALAVRFGWAVVP